MALDHSHALFLERCRMVLVDLQPPERKSVSLSH